MQTIVLIEKIEQYLTETDKLFAGESHFKPAMTYMINHFWSIIAYQYNDENLNKLKILRDSLLNKIDSVDRQLNCKTQAPAAADSAAEKSYSGASTTSVDSSINVIDLQSELESFKLETEAIKNKMSQQSELMRHLLLQMSLNQQEAENRSTLTSSSVTEATLDAKSDPNSIQVVREHVENEQKDQDYSFSPGASPTSSLFEYFKKKWDMKSSVKVEKKSESMSNSQVNTAEDRKKQTDADVKVTPSVASSNENTSASTSSDISTTNDVNFYFYYNVNDYIAIDKNLALNEQLKEEAKKQLTGSGEGPSVVSSMTSSADSKISKLNETGSSLITEDVAIFDSKKTPINGIVSQVGTNPASKSDDLANDSFTIQCPVCMISVDSRAVPLEDYENHVMTCSNETKQLVCMFCLKIYSGNEIYPFERHVDAHMGSS